MYYPSLFACTHTGTLCIIVVPLVQGQHTAPTGWLPAMSQKRHMFPLLSGLTLFLAFAVHLAALVGPEAVVRRASAGDRKWLLNHRSLVYHPHHPHALKRTPLQWDQAPPEGALPPVPRPTGAELRPLGPAHSLDTRPPSCVRPIFLLPVCCWLLAVSKATWNWRWYIRAGNWACSSGLLVHGK